MNDRKHEIETALGIGAGRTRRWRGWALSGLAAAAALGLGYLVFFGGEGDGPGYVTQPATRGDIVVTVTATGSVEPTNMVDISSELSGTLAEVLVDFNDAVQAGQVLARLNTDNLEARVEVQRAALRAAEAGVARAQANLGEAQTNFQTAFELDERGAATRQNLNTARAALDRALAEREVAEADVALSGANLRLAETELAKACICSPINGVVLDRQADAGQIVAASLQAPVLFSVAEDLTRMELRVAVDEADIGRLAPGNPASFTVDAHDDRVFTAGIATIRYAPAVVDGVVTYLATLDVDNTDLALRPGMTATAEITVHRVTDALVVPNAALRFRPVQTDADAGVAGGGDSRSGLLGLIMPRGPARTEVPRAARSVYVLRDGAAVAVAVEPGDTDGRLTEIRGGDLAEGDPVIIGQDG
ncbi:MAG: efflux RND transporter periplasmic adaptor subunit [Gemmobacter sp.]